MAAISRPPGTFERSAATAKSDGTPAAKRAAKRLHSHVFKSGRELTRGESALHARHKRGVQVPSAARVQSPKRSKEAVQAASDSSILRPRASSPSSQARRSASPGKSLERLNKRVGEGGEADESGSECEEGLVDVAQAFISHSQAPVIVNPREEALHYPSVAPQLAAMGCAPSG